MLKNIKLLSGLLGTFASMGCYASVLVYDGGSPNQQSGYYADAKYAFTEAASKFSLTQGASFDQMVWFGGYANPSGSAVPTTENFRIRFYSGDGSIPGTLLKEITVGSFSRVATRAQIGGAWDEYQFAANLGKFKLPAGSYFIGMSSKNNSTGTYFWETSNLALGEASYSSQWLANPVSLAFLLYLSGPSAADTLASMQRNAQGLRNIFSLQASYVNPGLSYDCSLFDKNGVCVAFSGRNSVTSDGGPEATSGVLTAAFKVTPNIRVGGFVEQYVSDYSSGGVKVNANNPDFGVFGVWSQTGTDEGLRLRAAYRYGKRDVNITRDAIDSAEAGSGNSKLLTEGAQVTASYGYGLSNTMLASPYVGLRYTNIGRDGYTESASDTVTTPLHFDRLRQESTSLVAGVSLSALVAPSVKVNGSVGVETDIGRNVGKYSASGVADLAAIEFNDDTRRTRMLASVGVTYKIDRTQQIGAQAFYREEAYGSTATTTGMITYAAGF